MPEPLLRVAGLRAGYGPVAVLDGISLTVEAGEAVALIGPNGAGKTTLLRALLGLLPAVAGEVHFGGEPIIRLPAEQRARRGLALVPEGRLVVPELTVGENLLLGAHARRDGAAALRQDLARIEALFPRLAERRGQAAGSLSGGEQQMLAIGRALMSRPRLLLLDEPSMGLSPVATDRVFNALAALRADGVTLLLVEQNARRALRLADRAHVLERGAIRLSGLAREVAADPRILETYLGGRRAA